MIELLLQEPQEMQREAGQTVAVKSKSRPSAAKALFPIGGTCFCSPFVPLDMSCLGTSHHVTSHRHSEPVYLSTSPVKQTAPLADLMRTCIGMFAAQSVGVFDTF